MYRLNEEEIYLIAEQILLGEKNSSEFAYLSPEDLAKIESIVRRGVDGLIRSNKPVSRIFNSDEDFIDVIRSNYNLGALIDKRKRSTERKTEELYALSRRLLFRLFPIDLITKEPDLVVRKVVEEMNRVLSTIEIALLLNPYPQEIVNKFLNNFSSTTGEDLKLCMKKITEDQINQQFDLVAAKFSISVPLAIKNMDEASDSIKNYIDEYLNRFKTDLKEYCCSLPERFGVSLRLNSFTPMQWVKLAGLTPRRDIASLSLILDEETWKNLIRPLPVRQKEEVTTLVRLYKERLEQNLTAYIEAIDSLKQWIIQIDRVRKMEMER